jgi:hypothetical protein
VNTNPEVQLAAILAFAATPGRSRPADVATDAQDLRRCGRLLVSARVQLRQPATARDRASLELRFARLFEMFMSILRGYREAPDGGSLPWVRIEPGSDAEPVIVQLVQTVAEESRGSTAEVVIGTVALR